MYNKSVSLLSYIAGPRGEKNCTFIGFVCELWMIGISVVAKPFLQRKLYIARLRQRI